MLFAKIFSGSKLLIISAKCFIFMFDRVLKTSLGNDLNKSLFPEKAKGTLIRPIGEQIQVGIDETYEIVHQATSRFFRIDEVYKLVMVEMYEIGRFIAKFEYEYSKICVVSVVRA